MKIIRGAAYTIIALLLIASIVILNYKGKKNPDGASSAAVEASLPEEFAEEFKAFDSSTVVAPDYGVVSFVTDKPKDASGNTVSGNSVSGNFTGEIKYSDIVKLQEEELDAEFRKTISDYNKKYGISVSENNTSTSKKVSDNDPLKYNYVVNKTTKKIHRIGCLVAPIAEDNKAYFETISQAEKAGYKDRCPVCSP